MRKLKVLIVAILSLVASVVPTTQVAAQSGGNGNISNSTVICVWNNAEANRFFTAWDTYIYNGGCYNRSNAEPNYNSMLVVAVTGHDWTGAEIYRSFPDTFHNNDWYHNESIMSGNIPNLATIKLWATICPKPPLTGSCMFPALVDQA